MDVTVLLYPGVTALDAIGPYEVLCRPPGWTVTFAALEPGEMRTDSGVLGLVADRRLADIEHTDLLLIPGAPLRRVPSDEATLYHVRRLHETTRDHGVGVHRLVRPRARRAAGRSAGDHPLGADRGAPRVGGRRRGGADGPRRPVRDRRRGLRGDRPRAHLVAELDSRRESPMRSSSASSTTRPRRSQANARPGRRQRYRAVPRRDALNRLNPRRGVPKGQG